MMRQSAACAAAVAILLPLGLGSAPADAQTIAVFTKSQGNPVARSIRIGAETAARAEKMLVFNFIPTSADNVAQQTSLAEEALRSKPDAVVFTPTDPKALVPIVSKFTAAGIPVVNVNDRLAGGNAAAYVGSDDRAIARATAQALFKAMNGSGTVIILEGPPKVASSMARIQGFNDALKEFPNVKVLTSQSANYARKPAADLMITLLRKYPQIDGILAANDPMALGALDALGPNRRTALVVGINASRDAVDVIKSGQMVASGDYNGFIEGCVAAQLAIRLIRKESVPKEAILRTVVVDKSNLGAYELPVEKRACPAIDAAVAN
ncbi:MAG: sugar ABC transporter substrate-binding protein [Xanthobacteraceae bacterium]|nr:sugar ABC transporter substrate-binding protein [Xanthobacteraceae bacterium]